MLVIPPQLALYMALAPEEKLTFEKAGPTGQAAFEAGVAGFEARAFRGCGVVMSDPYEVSDGTFETHPNLGLRERERRQPLACMSCPMCHDSHVACCRAFFFFADQDSVQMLTRSTQVGEFYIMMPPQIKPTGTDYFHTCDLLIYDEESDKHVRISWKDAYDATCAEALVSDPKYATDRVKPFNGTNSMNLADWKGNAEIINAFNTGAGDFDGSSGKDGWAVLMEKAQSNPRLLQTRIVLARPFIEHLMHSAILCVAGRDTGATLFGPADMQLSANTQVKTIEGYACLFFSKPTHLFLLLTSSRIPLCRHYTGHFKSVVTKPQNVYVMRDIACAGYVAGCNTKFFTKEDSTPDYSLTSGQQNIMKRLSFADDSGAYGSMLAFPCDASQITSGSLDTVMSVTTRLLPWEVSSSASGGSPNSFPGGEPMFKIYSNELGLRSIHFGEDMKATENMEFISQGSTNNATCFIGPHRRYDPFTKAFYSLEPGQGHFGPDAIPGDARWRRGESVSLKAARDSMTGLELASQAQMARAASLHFPCISLAFPLHFPCISLHFPARRSTKSGVEHTRAFFFFLLLLGRRERVEKKGCGCGGGVEAAERKKTILVVAYVIDIYKYQL